MPRSMLFAKCAIEHMEDALRKAAEALAFMSNLFLQWSRQRGMTAAIVFTDVKAAFFFNEVEMGADPTRETLFDKTGLSDEAKHEIRVVRNMSSVQGVWRKITRDWQAGFSFKVVDSEMRVSLWSGTRLGDTLADVVFCLAFLIVQQKLEVELDKRGLRVLWLAKSSIFTELGDANGETSSPDVHGRLVFCC